MDVFGHDDVADDDEAVALTSVFQNRKEDIAAARCSKEEIAGSTSR